VHDTGACGALGACRGSGRPSPSRRSDRLTSNSRVDRIVGRGVVARASQATARRPESRSSSRSPTCPSTLTTTRRPRSRWSTASPGRAGRR
jgi:hypothetical protein